MLSPSGAVRAGLHHTPTLLCPILPPPVSLALPWCCRLQVQSERDSITRPPYSVLVPYLPRSPWPYPGAVAFRCSQSGTPSHAHSPLSYPTSPGLPGLTLVLSPSGPVRAGLHHTPTLLCPSALPPPVSLALTLLLSPSGAVRAGLHHMPTLLCPTLPPPVSLALPWCCRLQVQSERDSITRPPYSVLPYLPRSPWSCRLQVQSERDSITRPPSSVLPYLPRSPWPYPGAVAFRCSQSGTSSHAHPPLSCPTSPGLPGLTLVLSPSGAVRAGLHHTPTLLYPILPPPVSLALPWCCRLQET